MHGWEIAIPVQVEWHSSSEVLVLSFEIGTFVFENSHNKTESVQNCFPVETMTDGVSRSVSGYFRFLERAKKLLVRSTSDLVRMDFGGFFRNCYMINGKF